MTSFSSGERAQACYAGNRIKDDPDTLVLSIPDRKQEGFYLLHFYYPLRDAEQLLTDLRSGKKPPGMGKKATPADIINLAQALDRLMAELQRQGQNGHTRK